MQRRRVRWADWLVPATAALALGLSTPPRAGAQEPVPEGAEFHVSAFSSPFQDLPAVAVDADGDFVVVWSSDGSTGTDTGSLSIQGQRYASDGSALGAQFQVDTYTTNDQVAPSVAADANGNFVVVWESNGSYGTDTHARSVQGQRYASDGSTRGAQFQVNTYTTESQIHASVAADADGDFVVVWDSNGSSGTDTSYRSIQGQRYDSSGSKRGTEFQINTFTTNYQRFPSVAADANGNFVVVWQSYGSSGTDQDGYSIQGQRYGSDGSTRGAEFQVNTYTTGFQRNSSVAAGRQRRLRRGVGQLRLVRDGRERLQRQGPALRLGRIDAGRGVPGQLLYDGRPAISLRGGGCRRRFRGGVAQLRLVRDGHEQREHPWPALHLGRVDAGRGVPGQHLHDERPGVSFRGGG